MFYLAYGSNINRAQMEERCNTTKPIFIKSGYLEGYKLVFDGYSNRRQGLVADIRKANGYKVPYVIWEISSQEDIKSLDTSEGFRKNRGPEENSYQRKLIGYPDFEDVYVYVMTKSFIAKRNESHIIPSDYIDTIRKGYKEFGLDESILDYAIKEVQN